MKKLNVVIPNIGDNLAYLHGLHFCRKCIKIEIEIERRFNLIREKELTGETVLLTTSGR